MLDRGREEVEDDWDKEPGGDENWRLTRLGAKEGNGRLGTEGEESGTESQEGKRGGERTDKEHGCRGKTGLDG